MSAWLSDFGRFLWSVVDHWQAGVTGGVLPMTIFFLDKLVKKWRLRPRVYILIFVVGFLFMAFFSAWREQLKAARKGNETIVSLTERLEATQKQLETAQNHSQPKLDGYIYSAWLLENADHSVDVFLLLTVRNQGAPSIARGWHLTVLAPGMDHESQGIPMHYVGAKNIFYEPACNCDYIFEPNAALYLRVGEGSTPAGAERSDYLTFKFPDLRKDMIDKEGTKFY